MHTADDLLRIQEAECGRIVFRDEHDTVQPLAIPPAWHISVEAKPSDPQKVHSLGLGRLTAVVHHTMEDTDNTCVPVQMCWVVRGAVLLQKDHYICLCSQIN